MKPIAWIDKNTGKPRMEGFIQTDHDIPLYTTPQTKPLSDEEVWQVGRTLGYEFTNKNPNNVFLQFARAIEERHGIK